jgi:hypothetical protein
MSQEFPLLVAAAMARAYRSGKKTQTRRIVEANGWNPNDYKFACVKEHESLSRAQAFFGHGWGTGCKYGKVGDKLWLRETFAVEEYDDGTRIIWPADMSAAWESSLSDVYYLPSSYSVLKRKPSIHMPRRYCQTVLTINALRVERLQAITDQDALSEGVVEWFNPRAAELKKAGIAAPERPKYVFQLLWISLYGQAAWDANPYVWVIQTDKVHNAS